MNDNNQPASAPQSPGPGGLRDRTRRALEDAASIGDAGRLKLLESLYDELSGELERDVGENPSSRR